MLITHNTCVSSIQQKALHISDKNKKKSKQNEKSFCALYLLSNIGLLHMIKKQSPYK